MTELQEFSGEGTTLKSSYYVWGRKCIAHLDHRDLEEDCGKSPVRSPTEGVSVHALGHESICRTESVKIRLHEECKSCKETLKYCSWLCSASKGIFYSPYRN